MSRTRHHKGQKLRHSGHDYGGRYKCNKMYGQHYGVDGRDRADSERRNESKEIIRNQINEIDYI